MVVGFGASSFGPIGAIVTPQELSLDTPISDYTIPGKIGRSNTTRQPRELPGFAAGAFGGQGGGFTLLGDL